MKTFVTFAFAGMNIFNPYRSECSRFEVPPDYYGFVETKSTAFRREWKKVTDTGWTITLEETHVGGNRHCVITGYRPDGTMWHTNTIADAVTYYEAGELK